MKQDKKLLENKNVLITGINGFIGSNLTEYLLKKKANIYGIIRKVDKKTYLFYEKLENKIKLFHGDISELNFIKRIIDEEKNKSHFPSRCSS